MAPGPLFLQRTCMVGRTQAGMKCQGMRRLSVGHSGGCDSLQGQEGTRDR